MIIFLSIQYDLLFPIKLSVCIRMRYIYLLLSLILLSGCENSWYPLLYKPDVQQGNLYDAEQVARLRIGMDSDQVRYIMGDPLLINRVDPEHWAYVYTFRKGGDPMTVQYVQLTFSHDRLVKLIQRPQVAPVH